MIERIEEEELPILHNLQADHEEDANVIHHRISTTQHLQSAEQESK